MQEDNKHLFGGGYLVVCFFLALIMTCRIYPFIGLADGFTRWNMAMEIYNEGHIIMDNLLSPVIPYFQAFTYALTNSYALFTFAQCIGFYIAIGILVKYCLGEKEICIRRMEFKLWHFISLFILCIPTVSIFPTLLTDSVWVFILIAMMLSLLQKEYNKWFVMLGELILILLCVGIRINSLVLFGFTCIYFIVLWLFKKEKKQIYATIVVIAGCILGVVLPGRLNSVSYNAISLGMLWEMTGIVADTGDEELSSKLGEYGDIEEAVRRYGDPYLNSIVWDRNPPFPAREVAGKHANAIIDLYINTFFVNTKNFLCNKIKFINATLGVSGKLISSSRGIHYVDERTLLYGAAETNWQNSLRKRFIHFTDKIGIITLRPIVLVVICVFLAFALHILGDGKRYWVLLGIAVAYYSSFLINTQAHEFRYYAPSFYIMLVLMLCAIISIISSLHDKYKRK